MPSGGKFEIASVFRAFDKVSAPISRMANNVGKGTRRMARGIDNLKGRFKGVGKAATGAFGVAGVAGLMIGARRLIGSVITTGATLEQTLVGAGARFRDAFGEPVLKGTQNFKRLDTAAREIGKTTEFTANQAAGSLKFFAKAGKDMETALKLLRPTVNFATAAEVELARATDIVTDSFDAFGLSVGSPEQQMKAFIGLSDQMAQGANLANVSLEDYFETIKLGAPFATALNVASADFLAITNVLASKGSKGSVGGTLAANMLKVLASDTGVQKLRNLGIEVETREGELEDFGVIIDQMNDKLSRFSTRRRAGILLDIFSIRGFRGMQQLMAAGAQSFRDYRTQIENSGGATIKFASILRNTREKDILRLQSAMEGLTLTFSDANDKGIQNMVRGLTELTVTTDAYMIAHPKIANALGEYGVQGAIGLAAVFGFRAIGVAIRWAFAPLIAFAGLPALAVAGAGAAGVFAGVKLGETEFGAKLGAFLLKGFGGAEAFGVDLPSAPENLPPLTPREFAAAEAIQARSEGRERSSAPAELLIRNETALQATLRQPFGQRNSGVMLKLLDSGDLE